MYNQKSKKGFTLVELVIVILIIAILFVVLVPQLSAMVNKAKTAGVQEDFREFSTAAQAVAYEQGGFYGDGTDTTVMDQLNANLDASNQLAGATDSAAAFATVQDPWNVKYSVKIVNDSAADKSRGHVLFVSGGANGVVDTADLAAAATYTDGTGFAITLAEDDIAVLVGYDENGSVVTITEGFSLDKLK